MDADTPDRSFDDLTVDERADFLGELFRTALPEVIQRADDDAHRAIIAKNFPRLMDGLQMARHQAKGD